MVAFFILAIFNLLLFLFEGFAVYGWNYFVIGGCVRCAQMCAKCRGLDYDEVDLNAQGFVLADDLL